MTCAIRPSGAGGKAPPLGFFTLAFPPGKRLLLSVAGGGGGAGGAASDGLTSSCDAEASAAAEALAAAFGDGLVAMRRRAARAASESCAQLARDVFPAHLLSAVAARRASELDVPPTPPRSPPQTVRSQHSLSRRLSALRLTRLLRLHTSSPSAGAAAPA